MKNSSANLEKYFQKFRRNIVGYKQQFKSPYGKQTIHYFDWTASGRLYDPIEEIIKNKFGPFVGNTHSESSETGVTMTTAYNIARNIIKTHVNADPSNDILFMTGTGMTGAVNKLQRIIGFKFLDQQQRYASLINKKGQRTTLTEELKPVVFVTHMEHHSNQTSWEETIADVIIIPHNENGNVEPENLKAALNSYKNRKIKIGAFTACSNVTGIQTPYHELAKIMHQYGGYCFVDFAASAPYVAINMHPEDPEEALDAIFFSPHKFLGGPGTPGVLILDKKLYPQDAPPDQPGGGTVLWTNPWGGRRYSHDREIREDGGTPGFLQTIKAALCIQLKEEMGTKNIIERESYLVDKLLTGLKEIPAVHILAENEHHRLGSISFTIDEIHYNLLVKILNDRFGIQTRGGCSCAGTYGHCLLNIDKQHSRKMTDLVDKEDQSEKVGWIRASLHPTILDEEVELLIAALKKITTNIYEWKKDYIYNIHTNEFHHKNESPELEKKKIEQWFTGK
jgi:selenocysteine lyase/cysteine desulfurase